MQFGRFRLGMRTIKSALAVFLCILFFHLTQRGIPMIAALSAVFSLRQDLTTTVSFGKSRIIGNTLGGTLAIIYFFVKSYFHNDFLVELILLPILVIIVIVVSDGINNNSGIISAIATLLLIALSIPQGESRFVCDPTCTRYFYRDIHCNRYQFLSSSSGNRKEGRTIRRFGRTPKERTIAKNKFTRDRS